MLANLSQETRCVFDQFASNQTLASPSQPLHTWCMMKLSTIALAVASTAVGADANDYARTCKSWKVTGVNNVVLRACCLDARGYWKISELHLKHCLANHDGLVKYREGNFHRSCDSCSVQSKPNSAYTCRCYIQGEEQGWYYDTFNKLVSDSTIMWSLLFWQYELGSLAFCGISFVSLTIAPGRHHLQQGRQTWLL